MSSIFVLALGLILGAVSSSRASTGTELLVGAATTDITPKGPVALAGQMHTRISEGVRSPLMATAVVLEYRSAERIIDQAILVSCDLISIPEETLDLVRQVLKERLSDFDVKKLILNASHTHSGPVLEEDRYHIPENGVLKPSEYLRFLGNRLSDLVERAWKTRKAGAISWGLGNAVAGQNRRAVYADGRARMYGKTDAPEFRSIEGYEDHDVGVLFIWNYDMKLIAAAINVACPAQVMETHSRIDADYWHEVRDNLRKRYSPDLHVLGWIGAAGDQSPHPMYRQKAEERMRQLRNLTRLQEIARRISQGVDDAYEVARKNICTDVPLAHTVEQVKLPMRKVTDRELTAARERVAALSTDPDEKARMIWHKRVIDRHKRQENNLHYEMELHVIRLGDVAICTNPFELFTDFGIQIKARSKASQTFVIQLAGPGSYIPTLKAIRGGDYSTTVESNLVGPEGGQILVDRTVEIINSLWTEGQ